MRYITIDLLEEGMRTAKTIFNEQGVILLNADTMLTRTIIDKLSFLGYKGLLIEDEISEDVEYHENFVSQEVKISISKRLNNALTVNLTDMNRLYDDIDDLKGMIANLVDEMFSTTKLHLNLLELKMFDNYTYFHSVNVAIISLALAFHLRLGRNDLVTVGTAALLHDIGKIYIGTEILNKPGKLTDEEFEIMKTHSRKGYELLSRGNNLSVKTTIAVLSHHEHYDGSGYPNGLVGDNIILFGRIICIADVYDALTSERPYRKGCSVLEAVEYIMANSGRLFDPELVKIFSSKIYPYPVGCSVKLSNGEVGLVIENSDVFCLRPKLKIIFQEEQKIVDLMNEKDYRSIIITDIL